jgi:hypothetical protein
MSEQFKTIFRGVEVEVEVEVFMTLHGPMDVEITFLDVEIIFLSEHLPQLEAPITREELAALCRQAEQCARQKSLH